MTSAHAYRLFGLAVQSEIELPELPRAAPEGHFDVFISCGGVDAGEPLDHNPLFIVGGSILKIDDVATFAITRGNSIVVDAAPDAPARNVRLYLLGSAMGMLLHQRGLLPLHANAIEVEGRAVAFMGRSGAGKSTLAAWFHDRGHRILSDDVCVVRVAPGGIPVISTGLPRLRLWRDAVERSGREVAGLQRSYSGAQNYEKYDVALQPAHGRMEDLPLAGVYLLSEAPTPAIVRLRGMHSVEALFANTYRGCFVLDVGTQRTHWQGCVDLATSTPVFTHYRRWGHSEIEAGNLAVLRHARSL